MVILLLSSRGSHHDVAITSLYLYAGEIAKIQQSNAFPNGGRGDCDPWAVCGHRTVTLRSPSSPSQMHTCPFTLFTPWFVGCPDWALHVSCALSFNQKFTVYSCCQQPNLPSAESVHKSHPNYKRTSNDRALLVHLWDCCARRSLCCLLKVFLYSCFMDSWCCFR